ncbi:MAG: AAA family ATPase [Candidatus Paceibacterota bacterium]
MHAALDWMDNPIVRQAIWNLRDKYKVTGRSLVLFSEVIQLPESLKNDVIVIEEPMPNEEQLAECVKGLDARASACECTRGGQVEPRSSCKKCDGTGIKLKRPQASEDAIGSVVEAVKGLPYFGAEQVVAMALRGEPVEGQKPVCSIDLEHCWSSKRKQVEQTKGLSIHRGGEKFDDLGGLDQIKTYLSRIMTGRRKPKVIVWLDEIEKTGLANRGDTSGVNQDQEGTLLSWMEDFDVFGVMLLGVPGCGKSAICKAVGAEFDRVVIRIDLGAMQDSLVGSSQKGIRAALKVVQAIGGNDTLWLATSNSIQGLSSAMKSRFTDTFFFDLPPREERLPIWNVWLKRYGLKDEPFAEDDGWVARNIKKCCDKAYRMDIPVAEAAAYITPVALTDREEIQALRASADNRYLSASTKGVYKVPKKPDAPTERSLNI